MPMSYYKYASIPFSLTNYQNQTPNETVRNFLLSAFIRYCVTEDVHQIKTQPTNPFHYMLFKQKMFLDLHIYS